MIDIYKRLIGYSPAPMCASKTVLAYMHLLKHPQDYTIQPKWFRENSDGEVFLNSVEYIPTDVFPPIRLCVVRDPVERFVSAYVHRIMLKNTINSKSLVTFDDLIENYEDRIYRPEYTDFSNVVLPLTSCLGENPDHYSFIFSIHKMNELKIVLENLTKRKLPSLRICHSLAFKIDHFSDPRFDEETLIKKPTLTNQQIDWIEKKYKKDYEIYGKWF